jgi:hypothetical protein
MHVWIEYEKYWGKIQKVLLIRLDASIRRTD